MHLNGKTKWQVHKNLLVKLVTTPYILSLYPQQTQATRPSGEDVVTFAIQISFSQHNGKHFLWQGMVVAPVKSLKTLKKYM